jgi:hypothetical protein
MAKSGFHPFIFSLLGCAMIIGFGILYGTIVTTTHESCILLNKSYTSFPCVGNINFCEIKSFRDEPCPIPCNMTWYELFYDVEVIGTSDIVRMNSAYSFQFGSSKDTYCTCYSTISNRFWTNVVYKTTDSNRKPIITNNLNNYNSRNITNTYDCWVGSNGAVAFSNDTSENIRTMCFINIAFGLFMIIFGIMLFFCGKPSKNTSPIVGTDLEIPLI